MGLLVHDTAFGAFANAGAILARCTVYPWIVDVAYSNAARQCTRSIAVVQATLADTPDAESMVPAGCEFMGADVFPATRFDDMRPAVRSRYKAHYRAFLMWRVAHAIGKAAEQLVPWADFDPIELDGRVYRWSREVA